MNTDKNFTVILFDLGGVLLRLNDPLELFGLQMDDLEFKDRWLRSPSVRDLERGKLDIGEFAKRMVVEAGLPYDWQELLRRFDAWPDMLFDDTLAMLDAIPAKFRRGLLSNINEKHWQREHIAGLLADRFDHTFLSFETGLVKPDREAFERVIGTFACDPSEVLYFDDSPLCIAAASEFGMQAVLARGIGTVEKTLTERGVLNQSRKS